MGSGFSFRVKFRIDHTNRLQCEQSQCDLVDPASGKVARLAVTGKDAAITESRALTLTADGWDDEEAATGSGLQYESALRRALVRLRIGAVFGREPYGLGPPQDQLGLVVFKTLPTSAGARAGAGVVAGTLVPVCQLEEVFLAALRRNVRINEREDLAMDLFNAAMFAGPAEAKFVSLVVALESLAEPAPRGEAARCHVRSMIELTEGCANLSDKEKQSLVGSLRWLHADSIRQTLRKMVHEKLGERRYGDVPAVKLCEKCYDIRCELVHGRKVDGKRVRENINHLEHLVSDILSAPVLLDVGPR